MNICYTPKLKRNKEGTYYTTLYDSIAIGIQFTVYFHNDGCATREAGFEHVCLTQQTLWVLSEMVKEVELKYNKSKRD